MIRRMHLQKLLNVRASEWNLVTKLFWLQFFQGTGIAFFFTASLFSFLKKFPASELATVMIISSPLLFITGWIFNKFEHKLSLTRLGIGIIIAMTISILFFRAFSIYINGGWFFYLLLAWYYVLYLASNLGFWSITSTLFDVRQSKRLFSVISAGDIPAKFIGYTVAYFFVKTAGPINMLWPAALFILSSLPFLFSLSRMGVIQHNHQHHHMHHFPEIAESTGNNKFMVIIKKFTLNTLIRRVAILTFLISCCLAIINYAFYTEVKEGHQNDKSLSNFILLFLACSQLVAMLIKFVFTSRITTSMGIKKSLLITPLVLLALLGLIISAETFLGSSKIIVYAFGVAAISIEILRVAINNPVFLSVMQPLSLAERSKAHAIVKGIMDPFAFLFTGLLLLLLTRWYHGVSLPGICLILVIFTLAWLLSIILVDKSYRAILLKAISSRFFSQENFSLSDEDIQKQIKKKIETGNELEVINILQMLNSQISPESKELIFGLLDHPSNNVKKETILLIGNRSLKGAGEKLYHLANHSSEKEIRWAAVQTLCKEENSHVYQKHFSHHRDLHIRSAAFSGMLLSKNNEAIKYAEETIAHLINSPDTEAKKLAIHILHSVKDHYMHPMHAHLFNETKDLRLKAIKAVGKAATPDMLNLVFSLLKEIQQPVFDTLQAAGEKAVPVIYEQLFLTNLTNQQKEGLVILLGKIGGNASHHALVNLLEKKSPEIGVPIIVKALYRSRFKSTPEIQSKLEGICADLLGYAVELLFMQKHLHPDHRQYVVLINSLNLELLEIRNILLSLFACLYDHEKIFKVRQGLDMKKKDAAANAMEIIDITVKKELAVRFNTIFETAELEHKCNSLRSLLTHTEFQKTEEILNRILEEKPISYTSWTKACSMYLSRKFTINVEPALIRKYLNSDNLLLKETAYYAS